MAYADYAFYKTKYGTAISKEDFAVLSERASDYIDYITRNRADRNDPAVMSACCVLAEKFQIIEKARTGMVSGEKESEKVGSWSITYRSSTELAAAAEKELYSIALRYLGRYMYRGGCC